MASKQPSYEEGLRRTCAQLVAYCRECPGIRVVVVYGRLGWPSGVFMPALFDEIPRLSAEFTFHATTQRLAFVNGSDLRWQMIVDPNMIKGWEAHIIWFAADTYPGDTDPNKLEAIEEACRMRLRAIKPRYPLHFIMSKDDTVPSAVAPASVTTTSNLAAGFSRGLQGINWGSIYKTVPPDETEGSHVLDSFKYAIGPTK